MEVDKQRIYRRDPFAVDPPPRAHYHPSPERKLTRDQRRTAISPQRQPGEERPAHTTRNVDESRLSPMDEIFLRNTNIYQPKMTSHYSEFEDNDDKFDETWPSSERPSSMNLTGLEEESPMNVEKFQATIDRFTDLKKTLSFPDHDSPGTSPQPPRRAEQIMAQNEAARKAAGKSGLPTKSQIPVREKGKTKPSTKETKESMKVQEDTGGGSVLQRYVERFRNSAPLSREERERQKEKKANDFWWLSSSSPPAPQLAPSSSSVPKEEETGGKKSQRITPLTTVNLDKYSNLQKLRQNGYQKISEIPASPSDRKTKELQERAEKLQERSSSTVVSTEPAVSTEGLGSNTSGMSSLDEYSYRPKFAALLDEEGPSSTANPYTYIPSKRIAPACPEDDPLHQWRLRRRMEQTQETAPKTVQSFGFLTRTEQQKKVDSQLENFKLKLAGKDSKTKPATPRYQFTPAPRQEQVSVREPQIASPVLHRQKPQTDTEVDPHLHLMCDLLPCPHRGMYSDTLETVQTDGTSKELQGDTAQEKLKLDEKLRPKDTDVSQKEKSQHDKTCDKGSELTDSEKSRKQHEGRYRGRQDGKESGQERSRRKQLGGRYGGGQDGKESELFLDSDRIREKQSGGEGKYKQFLEAEKPDVEKSECERSLNSDRSTVSNNSVKSDRSRKDKDKKRKKTDMETVEVTYSEETKLEQLDLRKESKENREKLLSPRHDKLYRDKENEMLSDKVQSSGDERSRSQGRKKEKLRPRLSSSPVRERKSVDEAIGQVVKNHLFSMSTSTVISSVDSLPPSMSVEGLPRVPEHIPEEPGTSLSPSSSMEGLPRVPEHTPVEPGTSQEQVGTEEAVSYESDGDFEDDHLLQMLRKQRAQYEQHLRKIDAVLSNLETR